jgi:hypothetical protein
MSWRVNASTADDLEPATRGRSPDHRARKLEERASWRRHRGPGARPSRDCQSWRPTKKERRALLGGDSSSRCSGPEQVPRATANLIHSELDVNSWAKNDPDVEAARPSHCPRCELAAHDGDRLRLHGHGRRTRDLWGPSVGLIPPEIRTVRLRRYRCIACGAVCTVAPAGIAARLMYGLTAIATAMLLWGAWLWTSAETRSAVSPHRRVGFSDPRRWRTLRRWSRRANVLFDLPLRARAETDRAAACLAARLLIARGPPELDEVTRVAVGACAR